jgi:DNA polymerase-3 subunit alpha
MPAVAVTDSGNLFGALEFSLTCAEAGVQPVIGCVIAIRREEGGRGSLAPNGTGPPPDSLVVLVQDEAGYRNLIRLVSRSFLTSEGDETPQVSLAELEVHAQGLIVLTGGPAGPVGRLLGEGQQAAAEAS